jgi:hypothetical protein
MKASVTIHVETLWTNRAELTIEAELDNPHSETNQQVVSMMFEAARLMAAEARGENERALFTQEAINRRYRELDEREARLEDRDRRVTERETTTTSREHDAVEREQEVAGRERADDRRKHEADLRERGANVRERSADMRERSADLREREQMENDLQPGKREPDGHWASSKPTSD